MLARFNSAAVETVALYGAGTTDLGTINLREVTLAKRVSP
jgi:hypothetical protein